jgi:hypothetical protein
MAGWRVLPTEFEARMRQTSRVILLVSLVAGCATPETPPTPQAPAPAAKPAPAAAAQPIHLPTAIDLLVGHATELQLRPDQLDRIKAIGKKLDATNAPLEQAVAKLDAEHPASSEESSAPPPRSRGGSGMGGGMGGGGFRGGRRGGMGGGGRGRGGSGGSSQAPAAHTQQSDKAGSTRKEMAENHADAVADAFSVLDDHQQQRAAKLLDENDFDPPSVESVRTAKPERAGEAHDPAAP